MDGPKLIELLESIVIELKRMNALTAFQLKRATPQKGSMSDDGPDEYRGILWDLTRDLPTDFGD